MNWFVPLRLWSLRTFYHFRLFHQNENVANFINLLTVNKEWISFLQIISTNICELNKFLKKNRYILQLSKLIFTTNHTFRPIMLKQHQMRTTNLWGLRFKENTSNGIVKMNGQKTSQLGVYKTLTDIIVIYLNSKSWIEIYNYKKSMCYDMTSLLSTCKDFNAFQKIRIFWRNNSK